MTKNNNFENNFIFVNFKKINDNELKLILNNFDNWKQWYFENYKKLIEIFKNSILLYKEIKNINWNNINYILEYFSKKITINNKYYLWILDIKIYNRNKKLIDKYKKLVIIDENFNIKTQLFRFKLQSVFLLFWKLINNFNIDKKWNWSFEIVIW